MYIHSATHLSVVLDCAGMNILDMIDDGGVPTLVLGAWLSASARFLLVFSSRQISSVWTVERKSVGHD